MSKQLVTRTAFSRVRKSGFRLPAVAFVAAALTLSAWAWVITAGKGETVRPASGAVATTAPSRSLPAQDRVEAETITLGSSGFEPAEIRRPAGRFLLALDKLSDVDQATVRLESEGGQVLQEVTLERSQRRWRKVVDLTAGVYLLTVAGHPEWRCQIFIY